MSNTLPEHEYWKQLCIERTEKLTKTKALLKETETILKVVEGACGETSKEAEELLQRIQEMGDG